MGYYTRYTLETSGQPDDIREIIEGVDVEGNPATVYKITPRTCEDVLCELEAKLGFSIDDYAIKWYNHEEDIREFSKEHPDVLFTLEGWGEEQGDIWRKYFKNGKYYQVKAEINYPEFDETKLTKD